MTIEIMRFAVFYDRIISSYIRRTLLDHCPLASVDESGLVFTREMWPNLYGHSIKNAYWYSMKRDDSRKLLEFSGWLH